jgi:hypothetical protein
MNGLGLNVITQRVRVQQHHKVGGIKNIVKMTMVVLESDVDASKAERQPCTIPIKASGAWICGIVDVRHQ